MKHSLTLTVVRNLARRLLGLLMVGMFACSVDQSAELDRELQALSQRSRFAVQMVQDALHEPMDASVGWSTGVKEIELVVRSLGQLESDVAATDSQRLIAVVYQARAWDDIANVVQAAGDRVGDHQIASSELARQILRDKAFPARIAARNSFDRALRMGCRLGLTHSQVWLEIVDGVQRYSEADATVSCYKSIQ